MTATKIILYVDDDVDDQSWVSEACKVVNASLKLIFLDTGKQVIDHLQQLEPTHLPSLIVLDLNMPELDGKQTLKALKDHDDFKHIPVAVVTTSSSKLDKEVCKRLGAVQYLTKPYSHTEWQDIVRALEPYVQ